MGVSSHGGELAAESLGGGAQDSVRKGELKLRVLKEIKETDVRQARDSNMTSIILTWNCMVESRLQSFAATTAVLIT